MPCAVYVAAAAEELATREPAWAPTEQGWDANLSDKRRCVNGEDDVTRQFSAWITLPVHASFAQPKNTERGEKKNK